MRPTRIRFLILTGIIIPVIFWSSTFIAANLQDNYNHVKDTISQLGAIGTPSESFMAISTWTCVIFGIGFLIGLYTTCRRHHLNRFPLIGIVGFIIMFAWAAAYPSGNTLHSKSGPILLLLLLGPLLSAILWKGKEFKQLRILSLLSFVIMLLILLRAVPSETIRSNYTGLIQRLVHFGWSLWFISLSMTFLTLTNKRQKKSDLA